MADLNELQRYWESPSDIEVEKIPEGESGLTAKQVLTHKRLEAIAEWFAIPSTKRDPRDIAGLARALGISTRSVRKWQKDPRMIRRVQQKTVEYLTYLVPDLAWKQYERAMASGDTKAAEFVKAMAMGTPGGRGGAVNVTTTVNVGPQSQDSQDEVALRELDAYIRRARVNAEASIVGNQSGDAQANSGNQEE